MKHLSIATLCGSLRKRSYNAMALQAAVRLAPSHMRFETIAYDYVPIYNQDVQEFSFPEGVLRVAQALRRCDGLIIASPEYNYSIAGPLKNLMDWVSRLPDRPFKEVPVALISAASGAFGGPRAQYDTRRVLAAMDALVLLKPEVYINMCNTKFDEQGTLIDPQTVRFLTDQLYAFDRWIARVALNE
jgi:chromate reductase